VKALDTNVLVRFLVDDDPKQSKIVYEVFKGAEIRNTTFWVPLLVLIELLWVLESAYRIPRNTILDSINELILMPILRFEGHETIQRFLFSAHGNHVDLSDILIGCSAKSSGCDHVLTFDKKASKIELFEPIESLIP
jgi:predicted nucleic-acid-binding protein